MKTFSHTLLTGLYSGTRMEPAVLNADEGLSQELRRVLGSPESDRHRINVKASVSFTLEADKKMVVLGVDSPGIDSSHLIAGTLENYQVRSESARPFVLYQLELSY